MAVVRMVDGRDEIVDADTGRSIWEVLNNEREGSEQEQIYCSDVEKIYLNWRNAPDSYILVRWGIIKEMAVSEWMRDSEGNFTKPQPADTFAWEFAKKWDLWEKGRPSAEALAISKKINHHSRWKKG